MHLKNFREIAGKPLYKWTTDFLRENQDYFTTLAFSSDKPEKFDISHNIYKIQRPQHLCKEGASHKDVVIHALNYMGYLKFDYVMLFQPTNPFRRRIDLLRIIAMSESVKPTRSYIYYNDNNLRAEYISGLGNRPIVTIRSGYIYVYSVPYLLGNIEDQEIITLNVPKWRGYNINTKEDFCIAEALYEANNA